MRLIVQFLNIPLPLRIVLLFLVGACIGAAVNLGIYRLAYLRRRISPWSYTRGLLKPRSGLNRIPILGWFGLRREVAIHGRGFWIRPMLLELLFAICVPALYWWEVQRHALLVFPIAPDLVTLDLAAKAGLLSQYLIHLVLLALLAVATFIDFDEQTIPDAVTVPGTILALMLAGLCPAGTLPWLEQHVQNQQLSYQIQPLRFDFPDQADVFLASFVSLIVGIACYLDWCGALLPRRWRIGVGVGKAWRIMWRRIVSRSEWKWVLPMALLGCTGIVVFWLHGQWRWRSLESALIGMAAGAAIIWTIRFFASLILQQEAMGFGDVTLMAMIGAFLGWQAVVIIFFLSPFAGAVVGLVKWIVVRDNVIPYGPFLCLATLVVVLFWEPIWDYSSRMFESRWLVPSALLVCLPLLLVLLYLVRMLRRKIAAH